MASEFYIAQIKSLIHYPNNDKKDTWEVRFTIPGIFSNFGENDDQYPRAIPLLPHVAIPQVGDNILVIRFNSDLDEFGYLPIDISDRVTLTNGNAVIDLTDRSKIDLIYKDGNTYTSILMNKDKISVKANNNSYTEVTVTKDDLVTKVSDSLGTSYTEVSMSNSGINAKVHNTSGDRATIKMDSTQTLINGHLKVSI